MTAHATGPLAIAAVAILLFGVGLAFSVIGLIRGNREDLLASAPIVSEQEVTLATSGEVLVLIDNPRTATDFRCFQIQLMDRQSGRLTTMSYSVVTAQGAVYGVGQMQVPFGRFNARAGPYILRIQGLQSGVDYSRSALILSRPYIGRMVRQILGIVLCGLGMLLSAIWGAWMAGWLKAG